MSCFDALFKPCESLLAKILVALGLVIFEFVSTNKPYVSQDLHTYAKKIDDQARDIILNFGGAVKAQLRFLISFMKKDGNSIDVWINSKMATINSTNNANFSDEIDYILEQISVKSKHESGLIYENVIKVELQINKYDPIRGASYIQTPSFIQNKKCTINIKNEDQKCFEYTLQAGILHLNDKLPKDNPERMRHYSNKKMIKYNTRRWNPLLINITDIEIGMFCSLTGPLVHGLLTSIQTQLY